MRSTETHREARTTHREAQRSTEKHGEAQRGAEKHREAQRSREKQQAQVGWRGWVGWGGMGWVTQLAKVEAILTRGQVPGRCLDGVFLSEKVCSLCVLRGCSLCSQCVVSVCESRSFGKIGGQREGRFERCLLLPWGVGELAFVDGGAEHEKTSSLATPARTRAFFLCVLGEAKNKKSFWRGEIQRKHSRFDPGLFPLFNLKK